MSGLLARVGRWNRTSVFLITLAITLVALFLPGAWGAGLLLVAIVGLGALLVLTWPLLPPVQRLLRPVILLMLVVIAVSKLTS